MHPDRSIDGNSAANSLIGDRLLYSKRVKLSRHNSSPMALIEGNCSFRMFVVWSARFKVEVIITSGFIEWTLLLLLLLLPLAGDIDKEESDSSKADLSDRASPHPFSDSPGSTIEALKLPPPTLLLILLLLEIPARTDELELELLSSVEPSDTKLEEEEVSLGDEGREREGVRDLTRMRKKG